jgi:ubiquinone/menaquinone biosynthesis C-methylase UbiE
MEDSNPRKLKVWPTWALAIMQEVPEVVSLPFEGGNQTQSSFADRLYAAEVLSPRACLVRPPEAPEPYSLQWFLDIENQRYGRNGRWLPRLLEFTRHSGETLLGLGQGLGTDWLQYGRHGATVVVCVPQAEQLALVQRNFDLRGLPGRFLSAQPSCLPLEASSIDVVCLSNLLEDVVDPQAVVDEVYRVLKPGGKVLALTRARLDVAYWSRLFLPWLRWLRPRPSASACGFTGRTLTRLFTRFVEQRVYKRQLRRREVPYAWRWLPLPLLERLMGSSLVYKGFKPLSAAISTPPLAA